jgi:hypothetical protein
MHPAVRTWLASLSYGRQAVEGLEPAPFDPVGRLARVYETARNALEYRAEHLVRRAAIERILRRQILFGESAKVLSEELLQELKWARYITDSELENLTLEQMQPVVEKYLQFLKSAQVEKDWLTGVMSAEIEEKINPNNDYYRFNSFAFNSLKKRIDLPEETRLDLLLFVAVDKAYSQSDEQQVAYHLFKLMRGQALKAGEKNEQKVLEAAQNSYRITVNNPTLNNLVAFVRRQMGPLVLLRDMYFANPTKFAKEISDEQTFKTDAKYVLADQLMQMHKRMATASVRSLIYVFLTKMLLVLLIEIPAEKFFGGSPEYLTLLINLMFPVIIMWMLTSRIKLPDKLNQERLISRSWQIVASFDMTVPKDEVFSTLKSRASMFQKTLFYGLYILLFAGIFAGIISALNRARFSVISTLIFIFFLCVVSFFAFRIRQTAQTYTYRPKVQAKTSWGDLLMLPIVVMGSWLSRGVSRLNFLVFIFDFILEAPFKIILRFLDGWSQFLSLKREEAVG